MDKEEMRRNIELINYVTDELLDLANIFNDVTTSDLQGIAEVKAISIIKHIKRW